MPEINKDFIKKRNKVLLEKKNLACEKGREMLATIDGGDELKCLVMAYVSFTEHVTKEKCNLCDELLKVANSEARNAMIY